MKLILIRSPQLLFYKMKSKKEIRTRRRIQIYLGVILCGRLVFIDFDVTMATNF